MRPRLLYTLLLVLLLAWADAATVQAQTKPRTGRGYRARHQPRSSDDVKLAPGMRLGRPLALTTDYMGRPIKPKTKLTSTPTKAKPRATSGSTMSAKGSSPAARKAAGAKTRRR